MNKVQQISVLGCGWLGLELAKTLIQEGFTVKGSTTSKDKLSLLESSGLSPYLIELTESGVIGHIDDFLKDSQVLVINVPPGLRNYKTKNHAKEIEQLLQKVRNSQIEQIVFVSSTTVFEDRIEIPEITNAFQPDGKSIAARQLIAIEALLSKEVQWSSQIVRPGGLFGEDRHPGRILSGRGDVKNPKAPINLIHRKDLILCIIALIENGSHLLKVNAVYPLHPPKEQYYMDYCLKNGLPPPTFNHTAVSIGKRINSKNTEQLLHIKFQHRP